MTWRTVFLGSLLAALSFSPAACTKKSSPATKTSNNEALRQQAETGDPAAQLRLAVLYSRGQGEPKDPAQAALWAEKAAQQGDSNAQYFLGTLYYAGNGVPQDYVKAQMWFSVAASGATVEVLKKTYLELSDQVAANMTPEQIAEAQRLAREWKPSGKK